MLSFALASPQCCPSYLSTLVILMQSRYMLAQFHIAAYVWLLTQSLTLSYPAQIACGHSAVPCAVLLDASSMTTTQVMSIIYIAYTALSVHTVVQMCAASATYAVCAQCTSQYSVHCHVYTYLCLMLLYHAAEAGLLVGH